MLDGPDTPSMFSACTHVLRATGLVPRPGRVPTCTEIFVELSKWNRVGYARTTEREGLGIVSEGATAANPAHVGLELDQAATAQRNRGESWRSPRPATRRLANRIRTELNLRIERTT